MKRFALSVLIVVLFIVSCAGTPPAARTGPVKTTPAPGRREGLSYETAIVISAENEDAGIDAEYAWLKSRYPGSKLKKQTLAEQGEKVYDVMTIVTAAGDEIKIYFDITSFYGKW